MKIPLPKDKYIKKLEVNDTNIDIEYAPRLKVALIFISLNSNYWPYLKQVIEDCKKNFLPQHKVDYFVWSDIPEEGSEQAVLAKLPTQAQVDERYAEGGGFPSFSRETIQETLKSLWKQEHLTIFPTEPIEWPHPTLMRYHLFLQQEEKLKEYEHIFYLDADMRVVDKISDEILSEGLLAAEHPMYSLRREYVPPYEPNKESAAYIPRPGRVIDDQGKKRFKPFYFAGGFQGGKAAPFIEAMKKMKEGIDYDFNKNYTAIWNDESHWNKYLFDYTGPLTVMPPSYVYPDSLIKEYYEPLWGQSYQPKIITLTKPFTLSKEGGKQLNQMLGRPNPPEETPFECATCHDLFAVPGHKIQRVIQCPGTGKPHQMDMQKI